MPDQSYLDWPFFSEEHKQLATDIDQWAASNLNDQPHTDIDAACRSLVKSLANGNWLHYSTPAPDHEVKKTHCVRSLCLIRETLARYSGLADFSFAMQGLGSGPIALSGTQEQKDRYLSAVRAGENIAAFALSEPDAGSDVAAISTTAEKKGDRYIVNGTKTWISNGGIADFYVVFARTGEADGARGLSAFIVDADSRGLDIAERIQVIAPHPMATLEFSNCEIPESNLLGSGGDGFRIAMATLDIFRSTVAAAALGFARRALDESLQHTTSRQIFGEPLAALQLTQDKIADMATAIDASALLIYRAAWTRDTVSDRVTREAAMAKLYATESAQQVVDQAVQLFGGRGVRAGEKVEELYREIRALRIYEGASEVQKLIIARQTLESN